MSGPDLHGWDRLRHGGLLLDPQRLRRLAENAPAPLPSFYEHELRRLSSLVLDGRADAPEFLTFVLTKVCGFTGDNGVWARGSQIGPEWSRTSITGEAIKPRQLWRAHQGGVLPVFYDDEPRLGIGRGRKAASQVVQWLRAGTERLAVLTNGRQWRLVFAGLDFDAYAEWDVDLWFEEGELSPQVTALRTLLAPKLWTNGDKDAPASLLQAIQDSRKGQAELSAVLGERVREAVELLVQAHNEALNARCADVDPAEIYRAACRVVMRMVVVLFAESRELLPRDNAIYHGSYGLGGLLEELEKIAARGGNRLARSWNAWPRVLALFRLVSTGSHHPNLPVPAYGGELFATAAPDAIDGLSRALHVFENACFDRELLSDHEVRAMLERITRTRVKLRQGRASTWVPAPVDFSDLSSEYIGILYEGLLDFELRTAPTGDPVIFLAVGNQPALPLSRLEGMDDKTLAALLEKMKDTSKKGDDEGGESGEDEEAEEEADDAAESADADDADSQDADTADADAADGDAIDAGDHRHATRTRAEVWARRAVEAGKLVAKPRGTLTPDKRRAHDEAVGRKAKQLVVRVVLPGEWFLVRWGGTRKGSGTFYTRPGLAVPTVQRTLRPLAYTAPAGADGTPDTNAPASAWLPKAPEEILNLKTCDPACGSGTFPVASLRYLTDALYAAVHHHGRVTDRGDRAIVSLLGPRPSGADDVAALGQELVPCRPDDPSFEPRLRAVLKRHVVERCIYGVDLDPLAVELCRLSLWIETMDRTLPFSFLDHKVKCGNGLVGAWFDQFLHYPVMAWKNREGGDKGHSNGVHFPKAARSTKFETFTEERVKPDLRHMLGGRTLFSEDLLEQATTVHADALGTLSRLHDLPIHDSAERSRLYREELVGSAAYQSLKDAMDLWCACWFWPADELDHAPLPTTISSPPPATRAVSARIAANYRFFHWELEFPDVFRATGSGFDAFLGNPPWDIAKPNSKEFFSNHDPLYRGLGNPEARQTELFADAAVERAWLDYSERFVAWSNFVKFASNPFGDPELSTAASGNFSIVGGSANARLHEAWRAARNRGRGFSDPAHPFRSQGGSDLNLYKLFVEQMVRLLRRDGRIGVILPAAIYSDKGAGPLRQLLIEECDLQWLFSFVNRKRIFQISTAIRFCCLIASRGIQTRYSNMVFGRQSLSDWEVAEQLALRIEGSDLLKFSPKSTSIIEIDSKFDLDVLRALYAGGILLGSERAANWGVRYFSEYHMTQARRAGQYLSAEVALSSAGSVVHGHWKLGERMFVAFYSGKMISQFDFAYQRWVSGHALSAEWELLTFAEKHWHPEFMSPLDAVKHRWRGGTRLVFRDFARASDERTVIAAVIPAWPCGNKVPLLAEEGQMSNRYQLALCCVLNSFTCDFVVRNRITGMNVNKFILDETPVPDLASGPLELSLIGARLSMAHEVFAGAWLELLESCPELADRPWTSHWAVAPADRLELRAKADAIVAHLYGLDEEQYRWVLRNCDYPKETLAKVGFRGALPAKGFWRTGIGAAEHPWRRAWNCDPELRLPNLALVAFIELDRLKRSFSGDLAAAAAAFAPCSGSGGWRLPDRLRLRDYRLGHDLRAEESRAVRGLLLSGPSGCSNEHASWDDCRRMASDLRSLWGAAQESPVPLANSARRSARRGRDSAAEQSDLFSGNE